MSIYSIGLSGLNAAQNALKTTSNNISNVYTPGYNREITKFANNAVSGGVQVTDIERQFNQFVANQLNDSISNTRSLEAYQKEVGQINNLLADREAGLSPLMQNFFSSIQDLAAGPADPATRQGVLGSANIMASQFRAFDGYLKDMQDGVNGQIRDEVIQINNLTDQLAGLNREISIARASRGTEPNGLLDQRDYVIQQINERMDVQLNIQDGKTYNISLSNGQQLVTGTSAFKLHAIESPNDPQRLVVAYQDGQRANARIMPVDESLITGGTLGGLMTFRSETLDITQNQIGQLAASMVIGFNDQHRLGRDLNGDQGENFFEIGQPIAYANAHNSGTAEITSALFDQPNLAQLQATDYEVRVKTASVPSRGSDFIVIRKDTGQALETSALTFDDNGGVGTDATLSFGGIILTFDDITDLKANDRFEVQPVRRAAGGLKTFISDLDKFAAGLFVTSSGDMNAKVFTAAGGTAFADAISAGESGYTLSLANNGQLTFTDFIPPSSQVEVNGELRIIDNGATPIVGLGVVLNEDGSAAAELVAGDIITLDGLSFRINGLPEAGETSTLRLEEAVSGPGDNRNALALQNLQTEQLVGGRSTLTQAYAGVVSDVGNRANIVQVNLDASLAITEQLEALQQSESGVNLDEEAANLIRFQQFYAANARVIDTASTLFDTILGLRN